MFVAEVIEQQERIEVAGAAESKRTPQFDAGALEGELRLRN